ncbi:MAG: BatA domain-containing protein [Chitinophagaceae bacterium]|nr:BatA domain-containing protein [Chitinophagaceae bacterium]
MLYDWIGHMNFLWPENFLLLLIIPFLIWWYWRRQSTTYSSFKVSTVEAFTVKTWKQRLRHWPFYLRLLAIAMLVLALARPQKA